MININNTVNLILGTTSNRFPSSEKPYPTKKFELPSVKTTDDAIPSSAAAAAVSDDEDDDGDIKMNITINNEPKRQRQRQVRFYKEPVIQTSVATKQKSEPIKRKRRNQMITNEYDASQFWYTREEINRNRKAIIVASKEFVERKKGFGSSAALLSPSFAKNYEDSKQTTEEDIQLLQWFSPDRMKQRMRMRIQMKETIQIVQERNTNTKSSPSDELLSQLLQRRSQYAVEEAIRTAYLTWSDLYYNKQIHHKLQNSNSSNRHYYSDNSLYYHHQQHNPAA